MPDESNPADGLMDSVSPTFKAIADGLNASARLARLDGRTRLGDGVGYDNGGFVPPAASLLRNDTGEDLPFDQDHRLTSVRKVHLEAGEYIVPTHLIPLIKRAE
jgi:hypothetical protein